MSDRLFGAGLRPATPTPAERTERRARQVDVLRVTRGEVARNAPRTTLEMEQRAADRRLQIERTRPSTKDAQDS